MPESSSFITRHPRLTILAVAFTGWVLILLAGEVILRTFSMLNIHFYTGYTSPGLHRYPYGEIPINSYGYPDEEFNLADTKPRVGYFGDSVTYGVGAGYGHRFPDLLREKFPRYAHWVFASVGSNLDGKALARDIARFRLDSVIYIMNLSDILPDEGDPREGRI